MIPLGMLAAATPRAGSGGVAVTWNPADKNSQIELSNGNLTATRTEAFTNSYATVRAVVPRSSGKYYFEVRIDAGTTGPYACVGVCTSAQSLSAYIGDAANGWSYYQETGNKVTNGTNSSFGASYTTGDVIGVAFDAGTGKVWFGKNGVWQGSGDPASGTGEAFSGLSGAIYPALSLYTGTTTPRHAGTARFKASDFSYTPPSGFAAWES